MRSQVSIAEYVHDNPCFGCLSASCKTCACSGENEAVLPPYSLRAPNAKPKKAVAAKTVRKKPAQVSAQEEKNTVPGPIEEYVSLPVTVFGELKDSFMVRAEGDGMRNAGIRDGDLVIFEKNDNPQDGDIAALAVNGALMCRRFFREGNMARVRREDGETPDVITDNYIVYGVLRGLIRSLGPQGARMGAIGG